MHHRTVLAAVAAVLAALAALSLFAPPLGGVAVLAGALGVLTLTIVARAEGSRPAR